MSKNDTFCLRLDEFERNIKKSWQDLQIETDFCDVTLACEDKQIKTHKVILSACSPVLRNILKLNQNPHPLIYLRRVKYKNLLNLLNFMYQGEANVLEEDLSSFLDVAEDLNIRGLSEGNTEKVESTPQVTNQAISKKTKTTENIIEPKYNDNHAEFEQSSKDNITDDTESNVSISTIERQSISTKQEKDDDNTQSVVSLLDGKQFRCEMCNKQYSSKSGLNDHNKMIHEGVRIPNT